MEGDPGAPSEPKAPCRPAPGQDTGAALVSLRPAVVGSADDVEVSRTVTPFGTLIRELASGRMEVHHVDGTTAVRNPTLAELRAKCELHQGPEDRLRELLGRLLATYEKVHGDETIPPSHDPKRLSGLPGHWRVARPDGFVVGRVAVPPPPPAAPPPTDAGDDPPAAEGDAAPAVEEPVDVGAAMLEQLGGGAKLVEDGKVIEYPIGQISVTQQVDSHTQLPILTTEEGLVLWGDTSSEMVCLHADGTRTIRKARPDGYTVTVERSRTARISCRVNNGNNTPGTQLDIECADGTRMEVIPRVMNIKAELVPSDPNKVDPATFSTNASVLLRHRDGTIMWSKGDGDVELASSFDVDTKGESSILRGLDRTGLYSAHCDGNNIQLADTDGNTFEVTGEQTVAFTLAVSMGDDFLSPRCVKPGQPYKHPDASFLPMPEDAPAPRLFVVYGDGEAEELLVARDVEKALRLADKDPNAVVIRGEKMGQPMHNCLCHTILRGTSSDNAKVPMEPVPWPGLIAGFRSGTHEEAGCALPKNEFTEFRQFIEYPAISEAERAQFQQVLARYKQEEADHVATHKAYGQGMAHWQKKKPDPAGEFPESSGGA
eukprot:gnl/TRDRNA2_/TRDRNA2_164771_c3_seq1.p1 gnl/TRDRNA2_/TRDRNA2_164771_c3~~gnl/TRDRNA2_/TRDRNA2_164771_c3_seq1.p1  ORF type:complete len:637 (-),score=114.95 gnl/TRDRNA2_/TRDRNA2_164771_c3_seq1:79-1881(-)